MVEIEPSPGMFASDPAALFQARDNALKSTWFDTSAGCAFKVFAQREGVHRLLDQGGQNEMYRVRARTLSGLPMLHCIFPPLLFFSSAPAVVLR